MSGVTWERPGSLQPSPTGLLPSVARLSRHIAGIPDGPQDPSFSARLKFSNSTQRTTRLSENVRDVLNPCQPCSLSGIPYISRNGPSRYPSCATLTELTHMRFGLIPFRSPLLRESRLLFFPRATKMFQFARLPLCTLCVQVQATPRYRR